MSESRALLVYAFVGLDFVGVSKCLDSVPSLAVLSYPDPVADVAGDVKQT